jgi:hypothetical protein
MTVGAAIEYSLELPVDPARERNLDESYPISWIPESKSACPISDEQKNEMTIQDRTSGEVHATNSESEYRRKHLRDKYQDPLRFREG